MDRTFAAVEYPAHVKDVNKALDMVGGLQTLNDVMTGHPKAVELRYRQDPFCHPLYGDHSTTANLLVKCSKKNGVLLSEVVGRVENTIKFKGMADFQYIPKNNKRKLPLDTVGGIIGDLSGEDMNVPPPVFSRVDIPQDYFYRGNPAFKVEKLVINGKNTQRYILSSAMKKSKQSRVVIVDWKDTEVPVKPTVEIKLSTTDREKLGRIQRMFEDRPIWSFVALKSNVSSDDAGSLKGLLPLVAYYFNNGPWRRVWVRMGHDPRKDPLSRKYQVIDLRVLPSQLHLLKPTGIPTIAPHKSVLGKAPRRLKRPTIGAPYAEMQESSYDDADAEGGAKAPLALRSGAYSNVDDYSFSTPPSHQQTIYQLCDVSEKNVQKVIQTAKPKASCNEKTGWFTPQQMKKVRSYMKIKLKVMLEGGSVDSIKEVESEGEDEGEGEGEGEGGNEESEEEVDDFEPDDIEQVGQNMSYLQTLMQAFENSPFQPNEINYGEDEVQPYTIFGEDDEEEDYEYDSTGKEVPSADSEELYKDDDERYFK